MNKTIQIPAFSYNFVLASLYQSSVQDRGRGYSALADRLHNTAKEIEELNGRDENTLTEVGADCHCDQRDADEIPVYLKADEIRVACMAMANITFGMIPDDMDILTVHRAIKEILAYLPKD